MTVTVLKLTGKSSRKMGRAMTHSWNPKVKNQYHKYRKSEPKKSETRIKFSNQKFKIIKPEKYRCRQLQIRPPIAARHGGQRRDLSGTIKLDSKNHHNTSWATMIEEVFAAQTDRVHLLASRLGIHGPRMAGQKVGRAKFLLIKTRRGAWTAALEF